jgi:hypothetical protein
MRIVDIQSMGKDVLSMLDNYYNPPQREMLLDAVFFAYLSARYTNVTRQHHIHLYGSSKPQRIDFRLGGNNPVVIELALRSPSGGGALAGSQNISELRKLCRVRRSEARLRALLLLDLAERPLKRRTLIGTYEPLHAGAGKFERHPVRIIYVHRTETFSFCWKPFRSIG